MTPVTSRYARLMFGVKSSYVFVSAVNLKPKNVTWAVDSCDMFCYKIRVLATVKAIHEKIQRKQHHQSPDMPYEEEGEEYSLLHAK